MTALDRVLAEQRECLAYDGPDKRWAMAGLNDWVAEEATETRRASTNERTNLR